MQRLVLWNKAKSMLHRVYTSATKYYWSHYNQWCYVHLLLRDTTNPRQKTATVFCSWRAKWFLTIALSRPGRHQLLWCVRCRLGVTHLSLLHIMSRHAPYGWLATSLFWYSAPTRFWKMTYPTFNWSMLRSHYMRTAPEPPLQAGYG